MSDAATAQPETDAPADAPRPSRRFDLREGRRDLWQIPTLLLAVTMLGVGLAAWISSAAGPDYDGALASVEQLIDRQEYDRAIEALNGPIREQIDDPSVTPAVRARFHTLRADALYLAQRHAELDVPANNARVIENYQAARAHAGAVLEPQQIARLADSMVSLGKVPEALTEVERVKRTAPRLRHQILKRVVEDGLRPDASAPQRSRATDLLAELLADPELPGDTRRWVVSKMAMRSLASGSPEAAIRRILPELQRLDSRLEPAAAEMFTILGQSYLDLGLLDEARKHLSVAEANAMPGSDAAARTEVFLAQIDRRGQDMEQARDRFAGVIERFPASSVTALALLGLGEIEADLGRFDESLGAYRSLVDMIDAGSDEVSVERADRSMEQRYRTRFEREEFGQALAYAELIHDLYPDGEEPTASYLRLARANRSIAEAALGPATLDPDADPVADRADHLASERARIHFAAAGRFFREHAKRALLGDPEQAAESLWKAADSLDQAGDLEGAAALFSEYVEVRHDDPRAVEGQYRLARTYQSRGDYQSAAKIYEELLAKHPNAAETYRSYVPLARCYLYDQESQDPDRAEELLLHIISGEVFEPTATEFRGALLELGRVYLRVGRYAEAIRRLEEALERYEDLADDPRFKSRLADAYRLGASQVSRDLEQAMPQSQRGRLERLREDHLLRGLDLYEQVAQLYDAADDAPLDDLDAMMRRNALLYRGDCAFDLGEMLAGDPERSRGFFERAIRYYDTSAQRYADDPSSLVAMIQIVNCYAALGKWREVGTANERARARLAELPPAAWEAGDSPMDRRYWERWLEASVELDRMRESAG